MTDYVTLLLILVAWVGHACAWTALLNHVYGRRITKKFLRPFRYFTGLVIAAAPVVTATIINRDLTIQTGTWPNLVLGYAYGICLPIGGVVFPIITIRRLLRRQPAALLAESTRTIDYWPRLGRAGLGDGNARAMARIPGNGLFRVDFTDLTLAPRDLPPTWDGLTILLLSDLHFHGTPSREFFQLILDEINTQPPPDIIALAGDFVDTDKHLSWLAPLLQQLQWNELGVAILGNHDVHHQPDQMREELAKLGYRVMSNRWEQVVIRGEPCTLIGHEGPWFRPPPDTAKMPLEGFRLCVSHTPDQFYWGRAHGVQLMLCGHVHGGQIRLPIVGSIFVPSIYSRRFDMGVFEESGTLMVVSRGMSGKEPLRLNCNPQVIRMTLKANSSESR